MRTTYELAVNNIVIEKTTIDDEETHPMEAFDLPENVTDEMEPFSDCVHTGYNAVVNETSYEIRRPNEN